MIVQSKFISFNLLANRFTYYSKEDHTMENKTEMKNRYSLSIHYLLRLKGDIYFLQEVDGFFYDLLLDSPFKQKYFISYSYCLPLKNESNKSPIGLIIMVNKKQYKIINMDFKLDHNYSLLQSNHKNTLAISFKHLVFVDNIEIANKKKLSQLLVIQNRDNYIILINCHFEGRPNLPDIRLKQFEYCLSVAKNIRKKLNKQTYIIIGGDFNESNTDIIKDKYITNKLFDLKLYNQSKENTSFSRFEKREDNVWYSIDKREKIDYILGSSSIKIMEEKLLPKKEFVYPEWNKEFDIKKNWFSDHKIISFFIEYTMNKTIKKKKVYELL